jgi:hypothetical protein
MDVSQARRIAFNESRFRDVNERTAQAIKDFRNRDDTSTFSVICECALSECQDMVHPSLVEYLHVRSNARWFIVRPEHVFGRVEAPVESFEGFWIIEKTGHTGDVAAALA